MTSMRTNHTIASLTSWWEGNLRSAVATHFILPSGLNI